MLLQEELCGLFVTIIQNVTVMDFVVSDKSISRNSSIIYFQDNGFEVPCMA